jgi:hypothetical protein
VVKEFYLCIEKRLSANRRECDGANVIYKEEWFWLLRSGHSNDLIQNYVTIDVCAEFELLEVKVPLGFLGTEGFSRRREGR